MTDLGARARVMEMITACWTTKVLGVAAEMRLPDLMAEGAGSASALAVRTGSDPAALRRLLRAMAVLGLCRQTGEDSFELTEAGEILRSGAPGSLRGMALHWGDRLWGALSQLDQSVQTGRPWRISGVEGFEHMASDPGQMAMFHQSMADQTGPVAAAMLEVYDFSRFGALMDVGGSYGALLAAILAANPALAGQVFDLPDLEPASLAYLEVAGVAGRAAFTGGSFFDSVPSGADAYMLKMIIHDWDDEHAVPILANCARAAGKDGVVLVMERIAPQLVGEDPADRVTIRGDLLMLTAAGGLERTEVQYQALFAKAGLVLRRIVPTASGVAIMETARA